MLKLLLCSVVVFVMLYLTVSIGFKIWVKTNPLRAMVNDYPMWLYVLVFSFLTSTIETLVAVLLFIFTF